MQSGKIIALEKQIAEIKEELCVTRNANSDLKDEIRQRSDLLSIERLEKQSIKHELADKMRTNDNLQAKLNDMKDLMDRLKMELADNENKLMKNMIVKDEALTKLKQELAIKQNSLDDLSITIQRNSSELEYWQKESQENMHKIFNLEQAIIENGAELVTTRSEMSNLHCQLVQQSDHLNGMMTSFADKEQALQNELDDKNTNIDNLHADNALLKGKLDDAKHVIQQLKSQHSVELEQWQKEHVELLEKSMHLTKDLVEKEEELVVARQEMSDLNNQLAKQSDHLNGMMTSYADKEQELQNELDDKNTNIDNLHDENAMLKAELDDAKYVIQQLKSKHSMELEEWQKERLKLLEKSMHLNKDLVEKEEELVAARQENYNLNNQLAQQSDHLNGMMTSYADKERALQNELDEKNYNIDDLQADIVMLKAELNDAKYLVQQLKLKNSSVKQELAKKEMMTKVKDEALAEREELIFEQNDTIRKHSIELEELQKERRELSEKTMHLNNDLIEKEEELVVARQEISDLNNQLAQQSYQLNAEIADKQNLQNTLADRKCINWRIVDKLELDNEMVKAKLHDAEELIEQLKMQHLAVKEQLTKDDEEKVIESKYPIEANNDGASSVENKENQNSLPEQHVETTTLLQDTTNKVESDDDEKIVQSKHQTEGRNDEDSTSEKSLPKQPAETTALPQEGVNKVESDADEKIVESKCQIKANNDGTSNVDMESKGNQNSLPKQHTETTALPQEGVNKVECNDDVESKCQVEANDDQAFSVESKKNQNSLPKCNAESTTLPQNTINKVQSNDDENIVQSDHQIEARNDEDEASTLKKNQTSLPKQHADTTALPQEGVNKVESDDDEKTVESKWQIKANNDGASSVHVESKENQNSLPKQHADTIAHRVESNDDDEKIGESKCKIEANSDQNFSVESKENQNSLPKQNAETAALSQEEIHKIDSDDDDEKCKCQIKGNNDGGSSVHLESKENQISLPKQHAETTALSQEGVNKVESTSDDDDDDDEKIVESKCQIEANNDETSSVDMESKGIQNSLPKQHAETTALPQEGVNKVESNNDVESKCQLQIEVNDDQAFSVKNKKNQNSLPKCDAETAALSLEVVNKVESDDDHQKIIESKCQIKANKDGASIVHMESKENQNSLPKQHAESITLPQDTINKVESDDNEKIVQSEHQIEARNDEDEASTLKTNQNSLPKQHADTTALPQEGVNKVECDDDEKTVESKWQIKANNDGASSVHIESKENQNSLPKQHADMTALTQEGIHRVESNDDEKIGESKCQIEPNSDQNFSVESKENQNSLPKQNAETAALSQEEIHKIDSDDDEECKCQIKANNDGGSSVYLESKENQISLPKQHAETTALSQEGVNKVESTSDDDEKIVESKCQIEANNDGTSALGKIENKNSLHNQHAETTAGPQEATNKVERSAAQTIPIISDSCKEVSH